MRTHPVFLRLEGRRCVVVGADGPAAAKAEACLRAGADVTLVAPELPAGRAEVLSALLDSSLLELVRRGACEEIDRLLARVAGGRLTLERLGVALGDER